jgi:hypothetical protein
VDALEVGLSAIDLSRSMIRLSSNLAGYRQKCH